MKRSTASSPGVFTGAHKWFTGVVTTTAAVFALMVNARTLGLTPWLSRLHLNYADHAANRLLLSPHTDTLRALGDTSLLTAVVTDAHGAALAGATIRWRSVDSSIATVDSGGAVVARAPGRTSIEATIRDITARATVLVHPEATEIELPGDSTVRLAEGDTLRLLARALDANGHRVAGLLPHWETGDSAVFRVDSLGLARAVAPGRGYAQAGFGPLHARVRVDVVLTPERLAVMGGDGQRQVAGRRLPVPLVLQARARSGQPVPGAEVRITPEDAEGRVEPETAVADAEGRVRVSWTLAPRAGVQRLHAGLATADSVLTLTAEADPAPGNVRLEVVGTAPHGAVGAELTEPVVVRATDSIGVALGEVRIAWALLDGGSITGSARTDSAGVARAYWTLGPKAGAQRLLVQVGQARLTPPARVLATAEPGTPAGLIVAGGDGQRGVAGEALGRRVVVLVRDAGGNPVAGASVRAVPAAGSVDDTLLVTGADGRASAAWTLGAAPGEQRLDFRLAESKVRGQVKATARVGPAARVELARRPGKTATPVELRARVTDQQGNPVRGATVTFSTGSGSLSVVRARTDSAGHASVRWSPPSRGAAATKVSVAVQGTRLAASEPVAPASAARRTP